MRGSSIGRWCRACMVAEAQVAAESAVALVEAALLDEAIEVPLHAAERAEANAVRDFAQCWRHLMNELVDADKVVDAVAGGSGNMI